MDEAKTNDGKKKKRITARIRDALRSPAATMTIGVVLIAFGVFETTETALEQFLHVDLGAGHGIMVLGVFQLLHSIVIAVEGVEDVSVASEERALEEEIKKNEAAIRDSIGASPEETNDDVG